MTAHIVRKRGKMRVYLFCKKLIGLAGWAYKYDMRNPDKINNNVTPVTPFENNHPNKYGEKYGEINEVFI
jgi:hypothetical protein